MKVVFGETKSFFAFLLSFCFRPAHTDICRDFLLAHWTSHPKISSTLGYRCGQARASISSIGKLLYKNYLSVFTLSSMSCATFRPDKSIPPNIGPILGAPMTALQAIPVTYRLG